MTSPIIHLNSGLNIWHGVSHEHRAALVIMHRNGRPRLAVSIDGEEPRFHRLNFVLMPDDTVAATGSFRRWGYRRIVFFPGGNGALVMFKDRHIDQPKPGTRYHHRGAHEG